MAKPASPLLISVTLNGQTYTEDLGLQAAVANDLDGLNRGLAEQAGRYAWWAVLETQARGLLDDAVEALKTYEIVETETIIQSFSNETRAALPSANRIKNMIVARRAHEHLRHAVLVAKKTLRQVQAGKRTIEQRKDLLIEISRNLRGEMGGHLRPNAGSPGPPAAERARQFYHSSPSQPHTRR